MTLTHDQIARFVKDTGAVTDVLLHGRHDNTVFTSKELERFVILVRDDLEKKLAEAQETCLIEDANGKHWAKVYSMWVNTDKSARRLIEQSEQLSILESDLNDTAIQLAAAQAENIRLREALEVCKPLSEYGVVGSRDIDQAKFQQAITEALSQPTGTSALEDMIQKAGEMMRERCKDQCRGNGWSDREGIRFLPNVTLDDLMDEK